MSSHLCAGAVDALIADIQQNPDKYFSVNVF
jgi:hypothetical protein